jgi:hypothetical protein
MPVRLMVVAGLVMLTIAACARPRAGEGITEANGYQFRCDGLTVATVINESDGLYHVVAWDGLKELRLGLAPIGVTRVITTERVSALYLIPIVDDQPITGRAPGNFRPRQVAPKGRVNLKKECM